MVEKCKKCIRLIGRKGFCEIMHYINDHDHVILSDLLPIAGNGTIMERREELLELNLISDKKIKEGRRNYIVYDLTPKGEKVLKKIEEMSEIMEG
jgi:predicted transcriptional regulator